MLSLAAVVPHGDEILVPDEGAEKLHRAMLLLRDEIIKREIEEYVFISPHNLRIDTHISILLTEYLEGSWRYKNIRFRRKIKSDRSIAFEIYNRARDLRLPVVGVNYGALEGPLSKFVLDWGTLIPLYFLPKRRMTLITPARGIKKEELVKFGELLAKVLEGRNERFALIVSADHAHAHSELGPYGYHKDAEEYDRIIMQSLEAPESILSIDEDLIENAKPDSYWQLLMLLGALRIKKLRLKYKVYQRPTYFGMGVTWYG